MRAAPQPRRVVITGAASGIGRATALAFARRQAWVGLLDTRGPELAAVREELAAITPRVASAVVDVTDEPRVREALVAVEEHLGGIDAVVGCAGVSGAFGQDVTEISLADWDRLVRVNLTGQFLLAKHSVPALRRGRDPAVVFVASDSALVAAPGMTAYCASKGGLAQFARALSVDLAPDGIRVNCICPSVVDTPMARRDLGVGPGGFGAQDYPVLSPEEVAGQILHLASPDSSPLTGVALPIDFGYTVRSSFPA